MIKDSGYHCTRCMESLSLVFLEDYPHVILRPRRFSKCKNYRPPAMDRGAMWRNDGVCKGMGESANGAIAAFGELAALTVEHPAEAKAVDQTNGFETRLVKRNTEAAS